MLNPFCIKKVIANQSKIAILANNARPDSSDDNLEKVKIVECLAFFNLIHKKNYGVVKIVLYKIYVSNFLLWSFLVIFRHGLGCQLHLVKVGKS